MQGTVHAVQGAVCAGVQGAVHAEKGAVRGYRGLDITGYYGILLDIKVAYFFNIQSRFRLALLSWV